MISLMSLPAAEPDEKQIKSLLRRNIVLPLLLSALTAAGFVLLILYLIESAKSVDHTDQVISEANALLRLTIDAETGVRGFLMTGQDDFASPKDRALQEMPVRLRRLRELVSDSPIQLSRIEDIEQRFNDWMALAEERMASFRRGDRRNVLSDARLGKKKMDGLRDVYATFLASEEKLRQERRTNAENTARLIMSLMVLFSILLGATLAVFGRRQLLALSKRFSEILARQGEQAKEIERQAWLTETQVKLQGELRGNPTVEQVLDRTMMVLSERLGAEVGRGFLLDEDGVLRARSGLAFDERFSHLPSTYTLGQGSIGQAARERRPIELTDLPPDYLRISSSLGSTPVIFAIAVPLLHEGGLKGVIELGFREPLGELAREALLDACERLAYAIQSAQARAQVADLLDETQRQSEELQSQQEELERNNEDLQQKSQELLAQQAHLERANSELEEQQTLLEEQKERLEEVNRELHRSQTDIREKAQGLEVANRYKSEFLANMSHELRTPLNSVLLLANLLSENSRKSLSAEEVEYANTIHSSATDLLNLINDILDLSKVEAGKLALSPESVRSVDLIDSLKRMFGVQMSRKGLTFEIGMDPDAPAAIRSDRTRVEQILRNLVSNALKFTERGSVRVRFQRPSQHDFALAVSITDTGIGIPDEKQKLVFEAFNQADGTISRKYGGTGLGLTISRELAHLLGGKLDLQSKEHEGSTFTIYLPEEMPSEAGLPRPPTDRPIEHARPPETVAKPSPQEIPDDRANLRPGEQSILIIEDDTTFAKLLLNLCRQKGFKCLVASDGQKGIADATLYLPTAIILDIQLPGLGGLGVLDHLKRTPATRHIPVHALSVENRAKDAMQLGAVGFASKPVSAADLEKVIEKVTSLAKKRTKHILAIEDNPVEQGNLKRLIGSDDVKMEMASTGKEALEKLEERAYDCIILDLKLPDLLGFEIINQLRSSQNAQTPVIIYTARDLTAEEKLKLAEYSDSVVLKGARSPERLLDEVTLFLHKMEEHLSPTQKEMLQKVRHREEVFQDKQILVVDDDMRNVFALRSVLLRKGFHVYIAKTGKEALDQLRDLPKVDAILMDIMMPELDGYEAMKAIRKDDRFKNTPIIALTAKAMKSDRERCLSAGASDYLAKPVDMSSLLSLLRIWLTR